MPNHVDPTKECFKEFRDIPRAGPIQMLNLLRFHEQAQYDDGPQASGAEAYQAYARDSGPIFRRVGGTQIWVGSPELVVIGPKSEVWDLAFIAQYPSAAAFTEMLRDPDYRLAVRHRQAAVKTSRLIRMKPQTPGANFGAFL